VKVKIRTSIPGPRSLELAKRRQDSVANGHGSVCGIYIEEAIGSNLIDVDGNIFIDYAGGIGTMNVGHSHPKVIDAINKQMNQYVHTCFTVAPYEPYVNLAQRLADIVPIKGDCKSVFFNSGAEAVENAIKISKTYTGRSDILVFSHAYHGRTHMTMSMTYKEDPYKKGFGPFLDNVHRVDFPKQSFDLSSLKIDPRSLACVVIEPVAGEGGFIPVSHDAMGQIRTFCDDNDIVMVADEVQTGFGRTGSLFSMEQFEVEPDLISLAKSIAGGLPLSGVVGRSKIMDSAHVGGIGGTFGGNPVSCAAALAVLDIMEDERLPERALVIGKEIIEMINILKKDVPWISEVRGLGAMQGICIIDDQGNPDKEHAHRIHQSALNSGLVMITAGTYGNIIRTLMPLVITEEELEESLEILSSALKIS
jgi:4-aminobutyrate aminotransferase/(S)-3-amino-2-methylpropionate transaminase